MSCSSAPVTTSKTCETLISKCEIPIIDLAHMGTERCPQKGVVKQVGSKLVRALSEKGLALLVNHGIPDCKMKAVYRALDSFCELPEEERAKYKRTLPSNHGYVRPGLEEFSKEDDEEARHTFNVTGSGGVLPEAEVPGFRSAVDELARDFKQLSAMLLTALAVGLNKSQDFLLSKHSQMLGQDNVSTLRLLYYPPLGVPVPGLSRCGAHQDYGTFTLLAQDCEGGLEVQTPHGERWGRVGHLPGAILVNTGDILACWTNDQLPALRHRVVVPEHCGRGRHSIAFFVHPDNEILIEPIDTKLIQLTGQEAAAAAATATAITAPCRLQKKKRGVLTAYQHLQRRFRETYAS
ncbi:2-oxoglutarate-dependent dioxygenase htyE [Cephus cinctus]|uniref:2-oxoglutarate-dependent dioxygenase htyE n=1 Tax=Cephus cinctus TaxID=211228 RepID=A0AAJ7FET2_CEPCN|nr:2-oxoglutarate-dependent dioxygenase htyE [Cephus cinctus]